MSKNATKIEWAEARWNPITGCWGPHGTPEHPARCSYCYAERMSHRLKGRFGYPEDDPFKPTFHPDRLDEPLRVKTPTRYFCGTMGDLFTPYAEGEELQRSDWLERVLAVMSCCPQHTFLVLTKQPQRAAEWLGVGCRSMMVAGAAQQMGLTWLLPDVKMSEFWPLKNLWLGVSCEDQAAANERIPHLLAAPAAHRFVSLEPLLGPVNISQWTEHPYVCEFCHKTAPGHLPEPEGWQFTWQSWICPECWEKLKPINGWAETVKCGSFTEGRPDPRPWKPPIEWIIVGAQTGAHPVQPKHEWVMSIVSGAHHKVAVFLKDNLTCLSPGQRWQRWPEVMRP